MSPCHRFSPFRCTSFLSFVVFSPHSSLLASAVTAVVLRVLLLFFLCLALFVLIPCFSLLFVRALCLFSVAFWRVAVFLCLALFVLLSVFLAVICARPLPFFLLLSALLFNKHRKPDTCSTAPRTART